MLHKAYRSVCQGFLFLGFFSSLSFSAEGQVPGDKPSEEELGVEYMVQCAAMTKYMAYVVGTAENPGIKSEDVAAIFDFELIYADRREKQGRSSTRYERTGRKILSNGDAHNYDERRLKNSEHDWTNDYFSQGIVEHRKILATLPVDQKYNPTPELLNPLYLPLLGPNDVYLGADTNDTLKDVFLTEELHDSVALAEAVKLGIWIHGRDKDFVSVIRFEGKQGGMPTETQCRIQKPLMPALDKCDPFKNSDLLCITKTKWKKHEKSSFWLPVEIESAEIHRYHRNSYEAKIYWWIDDEVPDEVFEFEDFKKAVIRRSKAHEMVKTLKDSLEKQE
jgi:hypothetical protein